VFGVSTVIGPLIGGFIVEHLSWRWIFYVNLPVGLVALGVIAFAFQLRVAHRERTIDYLGAALLTGALTSIVLFTSLSGTTLSWSSPTIIALIAFAICSIVAFLLVESRTREPLLPLSLFANSTFALTSAIGFIVGMALFGSLTYLPLYLQVVKRISPATSGLHLAPMMLGVLLTSVLSGQLIVRTGRYKIFPVIGTGLMTVAMLLLTRLSAETSVWTVSGDTMVLGLGLGMVMQVLVMAVQNSVPFEHLGAATAGATLFRMTGGSIGVALFGAIFANHFATALIGMPVGPDSTKLFSPDTLHENIASHLPEHLRSVYAQALAGALQPVFTVAAIIGGLAFALALSLQEIPLKTGAATAEGLGESFASPRDTTSIAELERIFSSLALKQNRSIVYRRLAKRAGVDLSPQEIWLLARLHERDGSSAAALAKQLKLSRAELERPLARLLRSQLVSETELGKLSPTRKGSSVRAKIKEAWEDAVTELCSEWAPGYHPEIHKLLDQLVRTLRAEPPPAPPLTVRELPEGGRSCLP
jgi:MFS family permease